MNEPKIVVLDGHTLNPGDISWDAIGRLGDLEVHPRSGPRIVERAAAAPVVLTNKDLLTAAVIDQLPQLQYIGVLATGVNVVDVAAATRRKIVVTNIPGYGADSVSQHVFALLLNLTNQVAAHDSAVADGQWSNCSDFSFTVAPLRELAGKTLGIVGVGAIGRRVAQTATALGMHVIAAHQRTEADVTLPGVSIRWLSLDALLAESDVVTLHCPLTEKTHHLISTAQLALMRPNSILINTSRGPLVDESALATALREGRIGGAALDVLSVEPPLADHPLLAIDRCIVTPHIAWATVEARKRLMQTAADNLAAFLDGQPVNVVNPEVLNN